MEGKPAWNRKQKGKQKGRQPTPAEVARRRAAAARRQAAARQRELAKERFEYHVEAVREFDDFLHAQDLERLREAARVLEKADRHLLDDEEFWEALRSLSDKLKEKEKSAEVEAKLKPFDSFFADEERLLVQEANLPRPEVVRLLDNVNAAIRDRDRALRTARYGAEMESIEKLRDLCEDMQETLRTTKDEISTVLASGQPAPVEDARRYRWVKDVSTFIPVLGGAATISLNVFVLAPSGHPPEPSMVTGFSGMLQSVFSENIVNQIGSWWRKRKGED
jgi:hypothetical protein